MQGVSKRVAKHLRRQEMWKVKKAAKKEAKKAAREEAKRQQQKDGVVSGQKDKEIDPVLQQERREHRLVQRREAQEDFVRRCAEGARVVVDCGFDDQMTEKELKSLGQQVMYVYASNKRAPSPCTIYLTELGPSMEKRLSGLAGTQNWHGFVREPRPYVEAFAGEREKLVYLTSDSPNSLTKWDRGAVYIIGGIVDRNRLKRVTYEKALVQGIVTARFPLQEYVTLGSTPVLTVNHVFDILLEFQHTNDWRAAFAKVLPQRKGLNLRTSSEAGGGMGGQQVERQQEEGKWLVREEGEEQAREEKG
ncbi:rna (guanine-9-)-methyltransferase domain-containing [Nannochloropsis oceanica]